MPDVSLCHLDDALQFGRLRELFERDNPGLKLSRIEVDGEAVLTSEHGGMRVSWIYRGTGQVFLGRGYRTQEGDGQPLPADYRPDPLDPLFATALQRLRDRLATLTEAAIVPARAIVARWKDEAFCGDFAGELWKLDHLPRPWSSDLEVEGLLEALFGSYRRHGWSTKEADSYEPLMVGDQIIACGPEAIRVEGRFACLSMENVGRPTSHVSNVRRLRYLADTAGGCNVDFDPFRRLPLTWHYNYPGETGDGLNWVNSHVVNIPSETSPAHFHPPTGISRNDQNRSGADESIAADGIPQREMYLVLDPAAYRLSTAGRPASLLVFPDLHDLRRFEEYSLRPGLFIYIPPGTGHRGLDAFVNVLTIPGFKPHNEYYIDRDIRDLTDGQAPFNENLLAAKNYTRLEDLLVV